MDSNKQQLLLSYLVSSVDTYALCAGIIEPTYFDPEFRNAVEFIQNYYEEYSTTPDAMQIRAETSIEVLEADITSDKISYCANEIESFCKRKALEKAVLSAPALIEQGDYGKVENLVKEALTVSLHSHCGLDVLADPLSIIERLRDQDSVVSTGWPQMDDLIGGGIRRKEMVMFSANSGGGKSIVMSNIALNRLKEGNNVLYISLELSEDLVAKRYFGMMTDISQAEVLHRTTEVSRKIEGFRTSYGDLLIKRMPAGTNANSVRALLKEIQLRYDYVPDVIVMDYLDLMGSNEKMQAGGNAFDKDKATSEELRELGEDYNAYIITASQQNRSAVDAVELNHSHIAGGISKINTTDVYLSIIMTDQMRAEGVMKIQALKTRNSDGVGKTIDLVWNPTLRIEDAGQGSDSININPLKKKTNNTDKQSEGDDKLNSAFSLLDI